MGFSLSHCHERLYTLGADVDERRGMDRGGKGDNGHRKRVSPIRDTQTQDVFIREL